MGLFGIALLHCGRPSRELLSGTTALLALLQGAAWFVPAVEALDVAVMASRSKRQDDAFGATRAAAPDGSRPAATNGFLAAAVAPMARQPDVYQPALKHSITIPEGAAPPAPPPAPFAGAEANPRRGAHEARKMS